MTLWTPDPTFYPSPRDAAAGPKETLAYVVAFDRAAEQPDALAVLDVDPDSSSYGQVVGWTAMPYTGDELHHFGWNMCSSALCPYAPHPHSERRYLVVPGLRSSRIMVLDTKDQPRQPPVVKVLEAEELAKRAGYSRPHTLHCGPEGIYLTCLGGANGTEGPGGVALLDHQSFEVLGRWEVDLGDQHQMVLELRPAHDPTKSYGFVGLVVSVEDLSASVWLWHRSGDRWEVTKVITIPAEPADASVLPPVIAPFGAVPPLVTDIDLSVDDQWLYVSCWGTGELKRYDVSDPFHPKEAGSVRIGGIVGRVAHPADPDTPLFGGPQMVEVSRDGRRVYVTNSLYGAWDDQFYTGGVGAWMAKVDSTPESFAFDERFFPHGESAWRGLRPHQVRLQGGDASSDSYCYP
jgi:methanethiol oxidase